MPLLVRFTRFGLTRVHFIWFYVFLNGTLRFYGNVAHSKGFFYNI